MKTLSIILLGLLLFPGMLFSKTETDSTSVGSMVGYAYTSEGVLTSFSCDSTGALNTVSSGGGSGGGETAVPSQNSVDNVYSSDVIGNKTDTITGDSLVSVTKSIDVKVDSILVDTGATIPSQFGMAMVGRPVTATLYVSPAGDGSDGATWATAYTTLNAALDAASTNANDLTAILLGPTATFYDINTTGDPTWAANVQIESPHRIWAPMKNTHASATSILKLTGKASVSNIAFFQTNGVSGVIFTSSGARARRCGFNSTACTSAVNGIELDGSGGIIQGAIIEDCQFVGAVGYTTAMKLNQVSIMEATRINIHDAILGISIDGAATKTNFFKDIELGVCATGVAILNGEGAHFDKAHFHKNTVNITETSTTENVWNGISGEFEISIEPQNLSGVSVSAGDGSWGADVEIRAAATATKPFKVIGYQLEPSNAENTLIRFSADSGATFFSQGIFATRRGRASGSGDATDFIFSKGTRISASVWSPSSGRTVSVWLEIQEI